MDIALELAGVRAELGRADTKAATLLGVAGTAVSIAAAVATVATHRLPAGALAVLWVAVALLAGSVATLLVAVRPNLPKPGQGAGWVAYAFMDPIDIAKLGDLDHQRAQRAELVILSKLARAKYASIRTAVHLLLAALAAVVTVPVVLALTGGA